jgi:hypothetical protein
MLSTVDTLLVDVINCSPDVTRRTLVRARYTIIIIRVFRSSDHYRVDKRIQNCAVLFHPHRNIRDGTRRGCPR